MKFLFLSLCCFSFIVCVASQVSPVHPIQVFFNLTYGNISLGSFNQVGVNSTVMTQALLDLMSDPDYGTYFQSAALNNIIQTVLFSDVSVQSCPQGSYSDVGATACTFCSPGTFAIGGNASSNTVCIPCVAGTYSTGTGVTSMSACVNCPVNTFSSVSGASSNTVCTNCPNNSIASAGANSISACVCKSGFYHDAGSGQCLSCPANSFCVGNVINNCPENSVSPIQSASINDCKCKPMYYGSGEIGSCSLCLPDNYCPGGQNMPTPCPLHSTSPTGSVTLGDCKCQQGYKQNNFASVMRNFQVQMSSCNCSNDLYPCSGCTSDCAKDEACGLSCDTTVSNCNDPKNTDMNLTCPQGYVQLYFGTNGYSNNKRQTWWIIPKNGFEIITLTFSLLNVHTSDLLKVSSCSRTLTSCTGLNGGNGLIDLQKSPNTLVSTSGVMKIEWRTDSATVAMGWKAQYTTSTLSQCANPIIKQNNQLMTPPVFVWVGDTISIESTTGFPLQISGLASLTTTAGSDILSVIDPLMPSTHMFQIIPLLNTAKTYTLAVSVVAPNSLSCGTLYLTAGDILYLSSNVSLVVYSSNGVTALDTSTALRGQRTTRLSWDTSAAVAGKYFLASVIGSNRVEVYIANRPGGMSCTQCVEGEVCFLGTSVQCPPYSSAPMGASDTSQCVCSSGYYTEKTDMISYARSQTIDTSAQHTCAVTGNGKHLSCFGLSASGQYTVSVSNVFMVATGLDFTCVLIADTWKIKCFGGNQYGQLGHDTTELSSEGLTDVPVTDLGTNYQAKQISCNGYSCCAVLNTGKVKCWGDGSRGQLGQAVNMIGRGTNTMGDALLTLSIPEDVASVTHGGTHVCALTTPGKNVYCWGDNVYGQLGVGDSTVKITTPTLANIYGTADAVNCHMNVCCAVMAGGTSVKCWGQASASARLPGNVQTNIGSSVDTIGINMPIAPGITTGALDVSVTEQSVCVLLNTQQVTCWGLAASTYDTANVRAIQIRGKGMAQCMVLNSYQLSCFGITTTALPDLIVKSSGVAAVKTCSMCPANSYCDGSQNGDAVTSCPIDSTSASLSISITQCVCFDGYFLNNLGVCQLCPPGKYCRGNTRYTCPANSVSLMGAASMDNCLCDKGFSGTSAVSGCVPCQSGYYKETVGNVVCTSCPAGTFSGANASVIKNNASVCVMCPAGYFSFAGSSSCQICPTGTFSWGNAGVCTSCTAGSYAPAGAKNCTSCPMGTYQPTGVTGDVDTCTRCPGGKFGTVEGGSGEQVCTLCNEGTFSLPGSTVCTNCPANTFSIAGGICNPCPEHATSGIGSGPSKCLCAGGYYRYNLTQCSVCGVGTFGRDGVVCESCPVGTFQGLVQQSSNASCVSCPIGSYNGVSGSSVCVTCARGSIASGIGASQCTNCPLGAYSDNNPSTCTNCPIGTFSGVVGSGNCTVCAKGSVTAATGASQCTACPLGSYADANGKDCWPCMPGTYSIKTGITSQTECLDCPMGYFCTGGKMLEMCPLGKYSSVTKRVASTQCAICPANSFCPLPYLKNPCPQGTVSNPGTTSMMDCKCSYGVSCVYSKVVEAVINLNMTAVYFQNPAVQQQFLNAVAKAAKTSPSNVVVTKILDEATGQEITVLANGGRSLLSVRYGLHVMLKIQDAETLEELDKHLIGHGLGVSKDYAWYAPHHVETSE